MFMLTSFLVALVVVGSLLYMLYRQNHPRGGSREYSSSDLRTKSFDMELVKNKWNEISHALNSPSGIKNGLIEADKMLDYVLQAKGYQGESMVDRLRQAQTRFSNKEAVWQAHKLRNQIVHEVDKDLVVIQVKKAIVDIGQAIRDLGVIL